MKTKNLLPCAVLLGLLILNGCGINKMFTPHKPVYYQGAATLKNGEHKSGFFGMPKSDADEIFLYSQNEGKGTSESIPAENVAVLELHHPASPQNKAVFEYLPIKGLLGKPKNHWLLLLSKSEHLAAYVGAREYNIAPSGEVLLIGTTQTIHHGPSRGTTSIQPSFPVYMTKKNETELANVGVRGGVSFEGSALRSGITRFLADDPALCDYIRNQKLEYRNIPHIVSLYNPERGNEPLYVEGKEVKIEKKFITNFFDRELIYNLEAGKPSGSRYGGELGLGIRSSIFKFVSYGGDLGIARF